MALFRGIQEYIALDANNITLVFDSGNIVNISGNIFLYPPQGHPILYKYCESSKYGNLYEMKPTKSKYKCCYDWLHDQYLTEKRKEHTMVWVRKVWYFVTYYQICRLIFLSLPVFNWSNSMAAEVLYWWETYLHPPRCNAATIAAGKAVGPQQTGYDSSGKEREASPYLDSVRLIYWNLNVLWKIKNEYVMLHNICYLYIFNYKHNPL